MKMKRVLAVIMAAVMLAGCAQKENYDKEPAATTEAVSGGDVITGTSDDESAEITPIYDDSAVVSAYKTGNTDGLDEKEKTILDEAVKAMSEFYRDDMSEKEAVIAAHDWIVTNLVYDQGELLAVPKKTPDTENPYGALVLRQGICMGYTTLFQLFMDMIGIDSQIIHGDGMGVDVWEEHAWNLVEIDGKYYHVDTTWDDFVPDEEGRMPFHMYTLVPDSAMEVLHRWNRDDFPKAESEDLLYYESNGLFAENRDDILSIQKNAYDSGEGFCEIMTRKNITDFESFVTFYWTVDLGDYYVTVYWLH